MHAYASSPRLEHKVADEKVEVIVRQGAVPPSDPEIFERGHAGSPLMNIANQDRTNEKTAQNKEKFDPIDSERLDDQGLDA
jgi:hypothetical protein